MVSDVCDITGLLQSTGQSAFMARTLNLIVR